MPSNQIAYYFQQLDGNISPADDIDGLIDLHRRSFERFGWEVIHVDESHSRLHPLFEVFDDPTTILGQSANLWQYSRACYMRWLAYAVLGCPFADYDVINYGFTIEDAENIRACNTRRLPLFLSRAGAMGLLKASDYQRVLQTYIDFIASPRIEGRIADEDINDMTIMFHYHPDWYETIPYEDVRFVKDYRRVAWRQAKLVHYAYYWTGPQRLSVIDQVRPPFGAQRSTRVMTLPPVSPDRGRA